MKDKNVWIWGLHSVEAAVEECPDLVLELQIEKKSYNNSQSFSRLMESIEAQEIKYVLVDELPKEYREKRTQGCVALLKHMPVRRPQELAHTLAEFSKLDQPALRQWALLDRIEDPRNFGAILRSAAAFSLSGVFFADKQQSPLSGVVAQTSAGQCFRVPLYEFSNLNQTFRIFEEQAHCRVAVAALDMDGEALGQVIAKLPGEGCSDLIWLLGSEASGLKPSLMERSTHRVSIPMSPGVESLNVSVASALAFYVAAQNFGLS